MSRSTGVTWLVTLRVRGGGKIHHVNSELDKEVKLGRGGRVFCPRLQYKYTSFFQLHHNFLFSPLKLVAKKKILR